MHPFRVAIEARDAQAAAEVLADDVVFRSPIVFKPYAGRDVAAVVLSAALRVFEDFAYETELASEDGRDHALIFRARVGDKQIQGCDFLHHNRDGLVDQLMVMVRPLSAALALRERMTAQLKALAPNEAA
jgi:SnoaL-like domain